MGWVFLAGAIASEVLATMCLRASDGLSRAPFVAVVVLGYVVAFALLSLALSRGVPLALAYGVWAAVGIALVAVLSVPLFGETLTAVQVGGLALIIVGAVALQVGGAPG